ncbi:HMGL-like domain protein [Leptospira borgpetersenii str. 200701203]|uniref:HMGL-like domain protein n=1 Tax=Leptospira borgpetersenii str. 200701203 TaxID=1193007 RepID=M3HTZ9_LEPBO|nr:HMGL-like domain protein [Leptospira borgpetersenii str. 200701203]
MIDCPYEGKIDPNQVLNVSKILLDLGAYEISLGETIGTGVPAEVEVLLERLLKEIPANKLAGHFHDTYGMAIANVEKAFSMGLRSFDSSSGGLGGCPYAKGAAGNLATDDLVYFLRKIRNLYGNPTPYLLWEASAFMEKALFRELQSRTYLANKKKRES